MKNNLFLWQLAGFAFTAVLGTLLHFLYQWTEIFALAPFSAVNESTFEHMKILFFPMLLFAAIQSRFLKSDYPNFWCVKGVGIVLGTLLIPVLFYTYNGAFGKSPDWFNILTFFLAAGAAYYVETRLFMQQNQNSTSQIICALVVVALCGVALVFVWFTFAPPALPLFQDPLTQLYGILK